MKHRTAPHLVAAVLAVALMLSAVAASADAASTVANGKIAFTRHNVVCPAFANCGPATIYAMNPDGTGQTTISNYDSTDPYWSPDGTRIAFASNWTPASGEGEIFAINVDGSNLTNLTSNPAPDSEPAWSRDGTKIVFTSWRDGCFDIYVMNADGTGQADRTNSYAFPDHDPAWSPDGTRIAFSTGLSGTQREIYVMNGDGSNPTNLTNNSAGDHEAAWSPDGTKIAFASDRDGNLEIYVMNANGTNQTRLTSNAASDLQPAWSPDGTKIAFTSVRDGNPEIYVMKADGTNQTRLTSDPGPDTDAAWGPARPAPVVKGAHKLTLSVTAAKRQRALRRRSVAVRVGCGGVACTAKASGKLSVPRVRSKRSYGLGSARRAIAAGKRVTLRLRLTERSRREARRALRGGLRSTVRLTVTGAAATASKSQRRALTVIVTG